MSLKFDKPALVYDVQKPALIEASAGSGKTSILTERWVAVLIYQLAWGKLDLSHALSTMAALTFTRKAAAEMKERIRIRLDELFENDALELVELLKNLQTFQKEEINITQSSAYLKIQKDKMDDLISTAEIGTIDAFILKMLRSHPLELNEDKNLNPEEGSSSQEEAQTATLKRCINGSTDKQVLDAFYLGVSLCGFSRWIDFFTQFRLLLSQWGSENLVQMLKSSHLLDFQEILQELDSCDESRTKIYQKILLPRINSVQKALSDENSKKELPKKNKSFYLLLDSLNVENYLILFQKNLSEQYEYKPVKTPELSVLREASQEAVCLLYDTLSSIIVPLMLPVLTLYEKELAKIRTKDGGISFAETTRFFLQVLKEEKMSLKITSKLKYFFADEFQDTSPIQKEIFDLITQKAVSFYVGDPKQSIYRFRGADVYVFNNTAKEFLQKDWAVNKLEKNYRSARSHIDFVNTFFCNVFAEKAGKISYTPQISIKNTEGVLAYTHVLTGEKITSTQKMDSAFADALAFIQKEYESSQKAGDILVLFRNTKDIFNFYYYLKKHAPRLPVSSSNKAGLYESPYITPLLAFLRAVNNPEDELHLTALLKTLFFRKDDISINTLFEKARAKKLLLYDVLEENNKNMIASYTALKDRIPLEALIDLFIKESAYETILSSYPGEALATLRIFRQELQTYYTQKNFTLGDFLNLVDQQSFSTEEAEFSGGEGENIRLMTIHKSKGLESPVVVYIHSDSNIRGASFPIVSEEKIAFNHFGKGLLALELEKKELEESFFEEKRLCYVAFTRAKEHFYICSVPEAPKEEGTPKWSHFFNQEKFREFFAENHVTELKPSFPSEQGIIRTQAPLEARYQELKKAEESSVFPQAPLSLSVSLLLDAEFSTPQEFERRYVLRSFNLAETLRETGEEEFTLKMPSSMDIGMMVHRVLQEFDCTDNAALNTFLQTHYPEFAQGFASVCTFAQNYWTSEFFQNINAGGVKKDKERRVTMLLKGGTELRATADLYVHGQKKTIVDYKISVGSRRERYRRQLSYYALMSTLAGWPIDELALFDLSLGTADIFIWDRQETEEAFDKAVKKVLALLGQQAEN